MRPAGVAREVGADLPPLAPLPPREGGKNDYYYKHYYLVEG